MSNPVRCTSLDQLKGRIRKRRPIMCGFRDPNPNIPAMVRLRVQIYDRQFERRGPGILRYGDGSGRIKFLRKPR